VAVIANGQLTAFGARDQVLRDVLQTSSTGVR
jgi:ABC-type protease/lipase transport system fused ATPase/permease subunit